ncbi:MAG: hypothetical protein LBC70_04010 [Chitinispirillales bacterium]|nr:hypothetical protein [Chitinispirillales bacterium]
MVKNKINSFALAHSYVPEIRGFGGKNSFAKALLTISDELLRENRKDIERLPEKHNAEFFARLSETLLLPQPEKESFCCVLGAIEPVVSENPVLLKKGAEWAGGEHACRLTEDFLVSGARLKKIILTNPEKQNSAVAYDGGEEFDGVDFSACFEMEDGNFTLYLNCENMLYSVSKREFYFLADGLDLDIYTDSDAAEWFIQSGEKTVPLNAKPASPDLPNSLKLALKTDDNPNFDEGDFSIGVKILSNALLSRCNFTNPLLSFGMGDDLKPDLIIRSGEAREAPFYPFGYPLEEKSDFFVACGEAFSTRGAKAALRFDLQFEEFCQPYEPHLEIDLEALSGIDKSYARAFKITPPKEKKCKADKVSFHYFNGDRFVLLPESGIHEHIFNGGIIRDLLFTVPHDMEICEIGGVESYWLRVCLEEAGDLYYRPCKMLCPRINNIQIIYGAALEPLMIKRRTAAGTRNIPSGGVIHENCYGEEPDFYMGFDGTLEGKLALFINIEQNYGIPAVSGEWEVSANGGFIPVTGVDDTGCFSYSGRIIFDIPENAVKCETGFSEESLYWLRVPIIRGPKRYPAIKAVYANAAEFSTSGDCSNGGELVLEEGNYQGLKAAVITDSRKPEAGENEVERIRHKISNAALMISETDIIKTLLINFPELEEIKCVFDNGENQLSVYLKFKGADQEGSFNSYAFFIKEFLMENSNYKIKLLRPVKALIMVRAVIDRDEREAAALREKLCAFLDCQSGGYNSRGWKIGELPGIGAIRGFFEKNGVKADKLVVSAGVYDMSAPKDNYYREYMPADLNGGAYVSAAGEILLICEGRGAGDGTDNP